MADYFPLLSRAVASLGDSTSDQRQAIYDRARSVLGDQLVTIQPKLSPEHIERELRAFDDCVARVERENQRLEDLVATAAPVPAVLPETAPASEQDAATSALVATPRGGIPAPANISFPMSDAPEPDRVEPELPPFEISDGRPRIEGNRKRDRAWLRPIVLGVAIFLAVMSIGITAFLLRDKPADFEKPADVAAVEPERKQTERLRPADAAAPAQPALASPAAPPAQAATAPTVPLQRAALFEETADGSQAVPITGRVTWKLETIKGSNGSADVAVRATISDMAGTIEGVDLLIRRNREPNFPASHVLEFRFTTPESGGNGKVRDIGVPEMRVAEAERGAPLAGLPVPVTDNVFLLGLTNMPVEIERNRDLLRSRSWILIPIRFANGRRALLLVEKGISGDRVMIDALQAWK